MEHHFDSQSCGAQSQFIVKGQHFWTFHLHLIVIHQSRLQFIGFDEIKLAREKTIVDCARPSKWHIS